MVGTDVCEEITIEVTEVDNLGYTGPTSWHWSASPDDTVWFDLNLVVPSYDTSGLALAARCTAGTKGIVAYFIAGGSRFHFDEGNPRTAFRAPVVGKPSNPGRHHPPLPPEDANPSGHLGYIDKDGNYIEADSVPPREKAAMEIAMEKYNFQPGDTTMLWVRDEEDNPMLVKKAKWNALYDSLSAEAKIARLHEMEKEPLTGKTAQVVQVGDALYIRHEGEYEFELAETYASREEARKSRRNRPRSDSVDLVLDLRDSLDYEYAEELIDSLIPMERAGYYRVVIPFEIMKQLRARPIQYENYPVYPGDPPSWPEKKEKPPKDRGDTSSESRGTWVEIFSDGFEDGFSANWDVRDDDTGAGEDTWWRLNDAYCQPSDSFWCAWCAGSGDMYPGSTYDLFMQSYMSQWSYLNIEVYTDVEVEFDLLYNIENEYDYLEVWVELNTIWLLLETYTGYDWSWTTECFDFGVDFYDLRLHFFFDSDDSVVSWGAYVDEVNIRAGEFRPNLTYGTPSFWDGPIVLCHDPSSGTNPGGVLWTDQELFINWGVANNGDDTSGE